MNAASQKPESPASPSTPANAALVSRHLRFGWWSLLAFLSLGILLETLHGFKIAWYLGPDFETRRLMWRLGHAHGTLLALVHIAYAATLALSAGTFPRWTSPGLIAASVLLPGGFLLGGIYIYQGDPGLGVLLVPLGAAVLLATVLMVAWRCGSGQSAG